MELSDYIFSSLLLFLISVTRIYGLLDPIPVSGCNKCRITKSDIEGPFYKLNAPLQTVSPPNFPLATVCDSTPDGRLILNGTIRVSRQGNPCGEPVRALMDIWQADVDAVYSDHRLQSVDFKCRARIITNSDGAFAFSTVFPGPYISPKYGGFRPSHIHFLITAVDQANSAIGPSLLTQLYFAKDQFLGTNDACPMCSSGDPSLVVHAQREPDGRTLLGTWNVLLASVEDI